MCNMKRARFRFALLFLCIAGAGSPAFAQAQNGSIDFVARATPSGGLEEPVRGFPFYVLSKSFEEIGKEAEASYPKPDMDAFIDKLEVSNELKAWMKKNHTVQLSGEDFIHKLKAPDVMGVPEFYDAYVDRNSGDQSASFPQPKYRPADKVKNPAKYEKLRAEYLEAVRHYLEQVPASVDGIDLSLASIDPSPKWNGMEAKREPEIHRRALALAQSKYLLARVETDLQGRGSVRGVASGNYWLSTLDVSADVGDARLRWDTSLNVQPGQQVRMVLSNANAVEPSGASPSP
jgi:hypothetical protein